ncbi:MAG: hypothetical protein WDZ80_00500 [Candidatus Paceibacterota bacterium]
MPDKPRKIIVNNISEKDASSNLIRIVTDNKFLFPSEKPGEPVVHDITVRINRKNYPATYTIGSHDKKERSGKLRIGADLYNNELKIKANSTLQISKANDDIYLIRKV